MAGKAARTPRGEPRLVRRLGLGWPHLGVAVGLLAAAAGGWLGYRYFVAPVVLPPPSTPREIGSVGWEDFVGAETCGQCHASQYRQWRSSTHGRAGGAPSREVVIARFDGRPIRFADATVTPRITAAGGYEFTVVQPGRQPVVLAVTGVIGGGHMVGGGTQGFVWEAPDGTVRFLPFDFIRREGVWFCNTIGRYERGWVPITPELPLEACADWPPQRVVGTDRQFSNCQECHGSQIALQYDTLAKRYRTRYRDLRINCESCHGPGRRHVELARAGVLDSATDIGLPSLAAVDKDGSLEICFRCHALKDVLQTGYLPGKPLEDYYSLGLPALGDRPWFPDGRVRTFAYQENHRFSDCYLSGSMTCVDCHDPHAQTYRDIWGRELADRFDDGQCLDCHASKADRIPQHTHHRADSPGSRCVACHMPYFQHPDLGRALRFARSDHTIAIPRPAFDAGLGLESACRQCHRNRSDRDLEEAARRFWGEIKPQPALVAALVQVTDSTPFGDAARRLLRPDLDHPLAQVLALARLLERYVRPDLPELDAEVVRRLEHLAQQSDLDVQALALAALHVAGGQRRSVRRFLAQTLRGLPPDREHRIRQRWKVAAAFLGDRYRERGQTREAVVAYQRALEVVPDDPAVLSNLGQAYAAAGQWSEAVRALRRSLARDPIQPSTLANLGLVLEQLGDAAGAVAVYERALALNPRDAVALVNLGNVRFRHGDLAAAAQRYREAIAVNASLAAAHFNLARVHALEGRLAEAQSEVEWGLAFEPASLDGRALLEEIRRARGLAR